MPLMLMIRTLLHAILISNVVTICMRYHEVSVIFWDEFISNDRILMEAVLEEFKTRWDGPGYYVFVCAGDFAQVCI